MPTRKTKPLTKKRIERERSFERTRENMSEFGRAGAANQLLRSSLRDILPNVADRYVSGRLTKRMMHIIQSDPIKGRGKRTVTSEALPMLEGFNFNRNRSLSDTLYAPYQIHFNRTSGFADLHIPFFNAMTMVNAGEASAYSITTSALAIDFAQHEVASVKLQTGIIEANNKTITSLHSRLSLPTSLVQPVIITLAIEFYTSENAYNHSLIDKTFNAMAVVKVFSG